MRIRTSKKKKSIKSIKSTWANKKDSIFMRIKRLRRRSALRLMLFAIFVRIKTSQMKKSRFLRCLCALKKYKIKFEVLLC